MAADGNNIYIFGGVTTKERVNTLHAYNIVDQTWTELPNPGESCKGRGGAGLEVVQGKIWVVYGFIGEEVEDVHCFDPVQSKWTKVETREGSGLSLVRSTHYYIYFLVSIPPKQSL